jgi:hypothetical protein
MDDIVPPDRIPGQILPDLARWTAEESRAFGDEESPFHASVTEGDPRLLLIVGENASGKSLAFRLIAQIANQHKVLPVTISIRERTGGGSGGHESMRRTFMYGDEHEKSTGANSARVVETGFHNLERDSAAILGLDEPEIGLSDGYAEALGEFIGARAASAAGKSCGVMVVTHSRRLARGLVRGLGAAPTFMTMTEEPSGMDDWIAGEETRSVEDLLGLKTLGLERWRAVDKLLKA